MDMTCNAEVKVHIKTNTADSPPLTSHNNVCDVKYLRWNCSLENKGPDITISLWPTSKSGAYSKYIPRQFWFMYVLNSHGNQVGGIAVNSSDVQEKVSSVNVETTLIQVRDHLEFDVVLSEAEVIPEISSVNKRPALVIPAALAILMKDIATQDFAFTFGLNGSARTLVSGRTSRSLHSGPHWPSLVRYLYTGDVALQIDLSDFAIGYPPNKPFSPSCKNRLDIDNLLSLKSSPSTNLSSGASSSESTAPKPNEPPVEPRMVATWKEPFQLADCYQVTELRQYCQNKIVKDLGEATSLDVLFGFAYRYSDLKAIVL